MMLQKVNYRILFLASLFGMVLVSCSSTKQATQTTTALEAMLQEEAFKIEIQSAQPQLTGALVQIGNSGLIPPGSTISRIDLSGQNFHINLADQKVAVLLPYFGESQIGGGYQRDTRINYEGKVEDLSIEKNTKKQRYVVRFNVVKETESFQFIINIFNNQSSTISLQSSHRRPINYSGSVNSVEDL